MFDGLEIPNENKSDIEKKEVALFLRNALENISNPKNWVQGPKHAERSKFLGLIKYSCHCSLGAIEVEANKRGISSFSEIITLAQENLDKAARNRGAHDYILYNDDLRNSHKDVMGMWQEAIAFCELTKA